MIFRVSLGDINVLLDDDITDERPTPEVCRDFLRACADEALRTYNELPTEAILPSADGADEA